MKANRLLLVIPCYNEAARLNFTKFNDYSKRIDFLFVDDGSQDSTAKFIKERITNAKILSLGKNMGKAEAVRLGMIYAVDTLGFDQYEWIGFLDADLAIPLEDIGYFFEFLKISQNDAEVLICSRVRRLGSNIKRGWKRHYIGRVFATLVGIALEMPVYDTQCGCKFFKPEIARDVFQAPFISRWLFDVELLFRLRQKLILEVPVITWTDIIGSKVKFVDGIKAFYYLLRIFIYYRIENKFSLRGSDRKTT